MRKILAVLTLAASAAVLPLHAAVPVHPTYLPAPPKPASAMAVHPATPPPATAEVCLNPKKDYDADYLSGRAVLIKAKVGKKPLPKLKADTNCIGIDGQVHVKLDSKGKCVVVGDALKLRRNGDYGWQTCQITQITPVTAEK